MTTMKEQRLSELIERLGPSLFNLAASWVKTAYWCDDIQHVNFPTTEFDRLQAVINVQRKRRTSTQDGGNNVLLMALTEELAEVLYLLHSQRRGNMAFISEEVKHEASHTTITVLRRDTSHGETYKPHAIIDLEHEGLRAGSMSPTDLMELGRWLIEQGQRIDCQYDEDGNLTASAINKEIR